MSLGTRVCRLCFCSFQSYCRATVCVSASDRYRYHPPSGGEWRYIHVHGVFSYTNTNVAPVVCACTHVGVDIHVTEH